MPPYRAVSSDLSGTESASLNRESSDSESCNSNRATLGCKTKGVVQQRTLLRRVLRRVLETAFEKVLRRVLRRCLAVGFNGKKGLRRVSRRGSKKGPSRKAPRRQKYALSRVRPPWRAP